MRKIFLKNQEVPCKRKFCWDIIGSQRCISMGCVSIHSWRQCRRCCCLFSSHHTKTGKCHDGKGEKTRSRRMYFMAQSTWRQDIKTEEVNLHIWQKVAALNWKFVDHAEDDSTAMVFLWIFVCFHPPLICFREIITGNVSTRRNHIDRQRNRLVKLHQSMIMSCFWHFCKDVKVDDQ